MKDTKMETPNYKTTVAERRREDAIATKRVEIAESSPQDKVASSSDSCSSTITTEGHCLGVRTMASFTFHLYHPPGLLLPTCTSCMQAVPLYNPQTSHP
jgi:hypothetical protein